MILCGDFNAIPYRLLDTSDPTCNCSCRSLLQSCISLSSLLNMWQCHHASEKVYSFFSHVHLTYSCINLFLVDKFLLQSISESKIHDITWSDHAPVSITISGGLAETRANRWHNDVYLMSLPENLNIILGHVKEFCALNEKLVSNLFILWNSHKAFIKGGGGGDCRLIRSLSELPPANRAST